MVRFCRGPLAPFKVILFVIMSKTTSVDWRSFCSEVTQYWLQNQNSIGGADVIVEINETLLVRQKCNKQAVESGVAL